MNDIHITVARNLKALRKKRDITLKELSELTTVSTTALNEIEKGKVVPSINTLWKIANGLNISFSVLVDDASPQVKIIQKENVDFVSAHDQKYRVYPYFPFDRKVNFEWFTVEMDPSAKLESEAHLAGSEEYLTLYEGSLELDIAGKIYRLEKGDAIKFEADCKHTYVNRSNEMTVISMIIYYP
ncbi:helix-turn-helix domain-containing protein [Listeria sp. PSOL-1]|uniref:helix-turn-helix domain-containing protein n=1 Tax=Listeria sp. PSOL-1 TaxID=1844999 RepID=UPI0013D8504B|nr:XRE family transcriptional regulator [Listeria sp. PSOL-1]